MDWLDRNLEQLRRRWALGVSPCAIGGDMTPRRTAAEVVAKAKELGLPDYTPSKPWSQTPKELRKRKTTWQPKMLPDGMVESAPGHVMSLRAYEIIYGAAPCDLRAKETIE